MVRSNIMAQRSSVAIIGDGISATTLAALLANKGADVVFFGAGKRADRIVGESMIPAMIPIIQRLGVEDEVAAIGVRKPGVTFRFDTNKFVIDFGTIGDVLPPYAYNVPRPEFDEIIARCAEQSGAVRVGSQARLERADNGVREVQLSRESLEQVPHWEGQQPDLIVDCTGRARVIARLLDLPAQVGQRKDVAYFAHFEGFDPGFEPEGQVLINRLESGWSWRIPLQDCTSVGVVINKDEAKKFGNSPEERLEGIIANDPVLGEAGKNRKRLSEVPVYTNYQLVSERGYGPGWVAAGDAFGFNDPMLSPGVFLAMRSAEMLADLIPAEGPLNLNRELSEYSQEMHRLIKCWHRLVDSFYNGALPACHKAGSNMRRLYRHPISHKVDGYLKRKITEMTCGASTGNRYSQWLFGMTLKFGHGNVDREQFAIR